MMTKKQCKQVARMWVGSAAANYGTDGFAIGEMTDWEEEQIMSEVQAISERILKGLPQVVSLTEALSHFIHR